MSSSPKLRVAIECRGLDPQQGIGSAVFSLADALSKSTASSQEYTFLVDDKIRAWLQPVVSGPCRLASFPSPRPSFLKRALRRLGPLHAALARHRSRHRPLPSSDGYVESHGFDLVHFPMQLAYLTPLPSIYQPWDLQHVHYPQFFNRTELADRDRRYRAFCAQARYICVQTEWSKNDLIRSYGIAPAKIVVIKWGSTFESYRPPSPEASARTIEKYALPPRFFFYPAVTWPHKNHEVIIQALQILKQDYGYKTPVYFSGKPTSHRKRLDALARTLGVANQIHFLGFVPPDDLQAIFAAATAMVFPSKFEGFGLPVLEAFHARVAVILSNATVLPEVALEANPEARLDLIEKGAAVLSRSSIKDTALNLQSLYDQTAGVSV
jgi:glycosyltransferase involved in cell wall biosynthesis